MTIQIDHNIPLPPAKIAPNIAKNGGCPAKYPFASMEVDDSFFLPADDKRPPRKLATTIRYAITAFTKRSGRKGVVAFVTRSVTENGVLGVRVWRVK